MTSKKVLEMKSLSYAHKHWFKVVPMRIALRQHGVTGNRTNGAMFTVRTLAKNPMNNFGRTAAGGERKWSH